VASRRIKYPSPRYREPIIIDPEAFEWLSVEGADGVEQKLFGVFNERRASASQIRMASGSNLVLRTDGGPLLTYVLEGVLELDGISLKDGSALEVLRGEEAAVRALQDTLLITFTMSDFSSRSGNAQPERRAA
jgi:hypothetical protein